jgi:Putative zinc-finger
MTHAEAIEQMSAERYLLNELTPEVRTAFEEHFFDCPECALNLRAGAAFIDEAKVQLEGLEASSPPKPSPDMTSTAVRKPGWLTWLRPVFAVPAFAALVAVVAYQNLATIPALREASNEPHLAPWATLHGRTRGAANLPVVADRTGGAVVLIDLLGKTGYASYAFDLYDPHGKRFWTGTAAAQSDATGDGGTFSLAIPGAALREGSYTLAISGVTLGGDRTEIDRRILDIHFNQ